MWDHIDVSNTPEKRVYGPVPSRRYGLSLGVDLVPHKTCCYDCIYCQVGRTTELTVERRDFFSPQEVIRDVEQALAGGPRPEVITLAGSGDPCLYASLGSLIDELHRLSDLPVVLLTNGGLLWRDDVLADALSADVLAPSLDAGDPRTFELINRPHPEISFECMLAGLREAARRHRGAVRMEVMLARGINDPDDQLRRLASLLADLDLASVDVNTPVRPAPGRGVQVSGQARLEIACRLFGPRARTVVSYSGTRAPEADGSDAERAVLELVARRPCTVEDVNASLGLHRREAEELLGDLAARGVVRSREGEEGTYYYTGEETDEA